ncbi:hypothetical protein SALBM311S_07868 [Streptomyces alboniger]
MWITTALGSRKYELISAAGRFTLMIDRLEPTIRYVSVGAGPRHDPGHHRAAPEDLRALPPGRRGDNVNAVWKEHGEQVVIRMRPERWLSSDLGTV